jgi:hypothetical protein
MTGDDKIVELWPNRIPDRPEFPFDAFFDHRTGKFFRRAADGRRYIGATYAGMRRYLKSLGYSDKRGEGEVLSPLDRALEEIETRQAVDYAAPLAGHQPGAFQCGGLTILVTTGPKFIAPVAGEWPTIRAYLHGLFGEEQFLRLAMHMKVAVTSLRNGVRRPGQALVIAGPTGIGKSLILSLLSHMLGGRTGKPYSYMTGRTDFNSELFGAEALIIDDEAASPDPRVRREFGARIKTFTVDPEPRCHAKNREALVLHPFWRLFIALNDDPHALQVLPQLEDGVEDKLTLLLAKSCQTPIDTSTDAGWQELWKKLMEELPAFLHYLIYTLEIPETLKCGRFGVKHYHNPELLDLMDAMTDELKLLELCDSVLWTDATETEWSGTSSELEKELREEARDTCNRLLTFANACGTFLGHLAKKHPRRVVKLSPRNGINRWKLIRPQS